MPTFETRESISVALEIGVGDIRISASDRTDTIVEVRPSNPDRKGDVTAAEQTRVDYAGGRLMIKAPKGWRQFSLRRGGDSIDVQIDLPAGSDVHCDAGVAAVRCTGRLGECRFKTGAGDVYVEHAGPIDLRSGAGDVSVDRASGHTEVTSGSGAVWVGLIDGSAVVKNGNGDTWLGEVTGELRVSAANGKIVVDESGSSVAAKTANGDVRLGGVAGGPIVAETAFGKIEVGIPKGVSAWLDLKTHFGNVRNDLEAADRPGPGENAVDVRAQTSFGDIVIGRSPEPSTRKEDA
jgi:Putative adhesin